MATYSGNDGVVKIIKDWGSGDNETETVAEVRDFSLNIDRDIATANILGRSQPSCQFNRNVEGYKRWSGTINCHWDKELSTDSGTGVAGRTDETAAQEVMQESIEDDRMLDPTASGITGPTFTLELYLDGIASADVKASGTVLLEQTSVSVNSENQTVTRSFNFVGTDSITFSRVP